MDYYKRLVIRCLLLFVPPVVFYHIFKYPTIFGSYLLLKILNINFVLTGSTIIINDHYLILSRPCIGDYAYLLLYMLIILTADLGIARRICLFVVGSLMILFVNILRIGLLCYLLFHFGFESFQAVHMLFWDLLSSVIVVGIWFLLVWLFKIKAIPIYTDIKKIWKDITSYKSEHKKHRLQSKPRHQR